MCVCDACVCDACVCDACVCVCVCVCKVQSNHTSTSARTSSPGKGVTLEPVAAIVLHYCHLILACDGTMAFHLGGREGGREDGGGREGGRMEEGREGGRIEEGGREVKEVGHTLFFFKRGSMQFQ